MTQTNALVLRCCNVDMTSRNGFRWPTPDEDIGHGPGVAVAPDWNPETICGGGLHGWLRGEGSPHVANIKHDSKWLVVEVDESTIVDINGEEVKFPRGRVIFVGERHEATNYLHRNRQAGSRCLWLSAECGDDSTLTGGDDSTLTGGYGSTLTGGDHSTLTGGDHSTLTGGNRSTLTGGYGSTLTGGYGSVFTCQFWDGSRYRRAVAYVGEGGIKARAPYTYNVDTKTWEEKT